MYKEPELYTQECEELIRIYREVAPECWTQKQACELVVNHEAPRFYVTPHAAYNALRKVFYGYEMDVKVKDPAAKERYIEILKRVIALSKTPEHSKKNLRELCSIAVEQKAPKFYMSPRTFASILVQKRKEKIHRLKRESRRKPE